MAKYRRKCSCPWVECESYHDSILEHAPPDHPWRCELIRLQFTNDSSVKAMALKAAIAHYLIVDRSTDTASALHFYPHHFPRALLQWRLTNKITRFTRPLTLKEANEVSLLDLGRSSLQQYTNTLPVLCRNYFDANPLKIATFKGLYAQTPLVPKAEVRSFVIDLTKAKSRTVRPTVSYDLNKKRKALSSPDIFDLVPSGSATKSNNVHPIKFGTGNSTPPEDSAGSLEFRTPPQLQLPHRFEFTTPVVDVFIGGLHVYKSHSPTALSTTPVGVSPEKRGYDPKSLFPVPKNSTAVTATTPLPCNGKSHQTTSPSHGPLLFDTLSFIKAKFLTHGSDLVIFENKDSVAAAAKMLRLFHGHSEKFLLAKGIWYYPCPGSTANKWIQKPSCTFFGVRKYCYDNRSVFCNACSLNNRDGHRRKARKKQEVSRQRPFYSLSELEKEKTNFTRQRLHQNLRKRHNRLIERLQAEKEFLYLNEGNSVRDVLQQALSYVKKNIGTSRKEVLNIFLNLSLSDSSPDADIKKREECANFVCESMLNMGSLLKGHKHQLRFSAHTVSAAMTLFLRNRLAYNELRSSGILCLPCPRKLRSTSQNLKPTEGGDPVLYALLKEELASKGSPKFVAHLLFDEIKLKNGIAFNCNSNEITGFVRDRFSMKEMYETILNHEDETKPEKLVTIYANQWRLRGTNGIVHNGDFFFNNGSLDGNEILRQFLTVINSYEFIGIQIFGLVSDGGGGNTKFMKLLRQERRLVGPWLNTDCVAFKNPVDPERTIYIWSCSTHSLKALRNNIYRSQTKKAKTFKRSGVKFGWKQIEDCFLRDEDLRKRGMGPRSDLVRHGIDLDKFTLMNARYAKMAFSEKTICEMIAFVAHSLRMTVDLTDEFQSQWHMFMFHCRQFKDHCHHHSVPEYVKSTIATIEYQSAVHGIYTERLLNKRWNLNRENFEYEKALLLKIVRYFSVWRKERILVEETEGISKTESMRYYLADATYDNLRILVSGFVAYAGNVIQHLDVDGFFVPALHSTQSSIEALFSRMRQMGKDTTDLYAGGIVQQNVINNNKSNMKLENAERKVGNSSYPQEDMPEEAGENKCLIEIGASVRRHRQGLQDRAAKFQVAKGGSRKWCFVLPRHFIHKGSAFGHLLYQRFMNLTLPSGADYQEYCLANKKFGGYYILSQESPHEQWFYDLFELTNSQKFEAMCGEVMGIVFHLLEDTLKYRHSSFEAKIISFLQHGELETRLDLFELKPVAPICYLVLFDFLKDQFTNSWLPMVISDYVKAKVPPSQPRVKGCMRIDDPDVNRCVGWGLMRVIRKYEKQLKRESSCGNAERSLQVLSSMKVLEDEILGNGEYIRMYYPLDDALRNKGFLTLICPYYVASWSKIFCLVKKEINLETVKSHAVGGTIKKLVLVQLTKGGAIGLVTSLLDTSVRRVDISVMPRKEREVLFFEIIGRILNLQIGAVVRKYRADCLHRKGGDVSFRKNISVLARKKHQ